MYDVQTVPLRAVAAPDAAAAGFVLDFLSDDFQWNDDDPLECDARAQRRRKTVRSSGASVRGSANDHARPSRRPKVELVLYTSSKSEKSLRAIRALRTVLERYDAGDYHLTIHDLATSPSKGDEDGVVFTPTLVKRGPGPRTWIVGNLDEPDVLVDLLDVNGVARRSR